VCSPAASMRCIKSFDKVLFMPYYYKKVGIAYFDCTKILNLLTYYLLVWASFTGLSTLLGLTKTMCTKENMEKGLDESEIVDITEDILSYLNYSSSKDCKVVRKFEYKFRIPLIHVKMYHIIGNDNKLHLVEIFRGNVTRLFQLFGAVFVATLAILMSWMESVR
jgi:hypothetical protein